MPTKTYNNDSTQKQRTQRDEGVQLAKATIRRVESLAQMAERYPTVKPKFKAPRTEFGKKLLHQHIEEVCYWVTTEGPRSLSQLKYSTLSIVDGNPVWIETPDDSKRVIVSHSMFETRLTCIVHDNRYKDRPMVVLPIEFSFSDRSVSWNEEWAKKALRSLNSKERYLFDLNASFKDFRSVG